METRVDAKVGIQSGQYVRQDIIHLDIRAVTNQRAFKLALETRQGAVKEGLLDSRFGAAVRLDLILQAGLQPLPWLWKLTVGTD